MSISRRSLLKHAAFSAGALALSPVTAPIYAQLKAQAAGTPGGAKRFVFILEGNGLPWAQITPVEAKRGREHERTKIVNLPMKDMTLPTALEPLAPWKDLVTVVNGLSGKICGGGHSNGFGALGVYPNRAGPGGETIDAALGKRLGGVFPQVGLGISPSAHNNIIYNSSAWAKGKALPTTCHPMTAYANLFGSVAGGQAKSQFQARTNVFDFLADDVRRLRSEVGSGEKDKLESHLEAYESLRNRQSRLNQIENTLRAHAPVASDKFKSEVETDRLDAHFDLVAASLIGGLTNVATIASGVGDAHFDVRFGGLGIDVGKHTIGHGGSFNGMTADVMSKTIRRFHFEQVARLMKKLQAVPEGNGTMLDNTVIVYLSDAADAHHCQNREWPFVVIGKGGGKLKAGHYLEYPYMGKPGHREIGNLYTTFLEATGESRPYFGVRDLNLKENRADGPLGELLA